MRPTKIDKVPTCSHCGEIHDTRVYADDAGGEFHCWTHMGEENAILIDLLDLTWGYAVVEDSMRILPNHWPPAPYPNELVRTIEHFSTKTPAEIRKVLEEIADAVMRLRGNT